VGLGDQLRHPSEVAHRKPGYGPWDSGGRWFVDETTCGTANSSIYRTPVKACWL
jgi:hypothetical protein